MLLFIHVKNILTFENMKLWKISNIFEDSWQLITREGEEPSMSWLKRRNMFNTFVCFHILYLWQRFSYCSEDSFQTPLSSPSLEWNEDFYFHNNVHHHHHHQGETALAAASSTATLIVTENGSTSLLMNNVAKDSTTVESLDGDATPTATHRPRVVLTPPDVNEAFAMQEYATLV